GNRVPPITLMLVASTSANIFPFWFNILSNNSQLEVDRWKVAALH
ncbi:unnamed protein product, partial [Adineta steineri]